MNTGISTARHTRRFNSLFTKILILLLVLTTLPIVVTGFVVENINARAAREQEARLEQQAFTLADTIAGRIKDAAESAIMEVYNAASQLGGTYMTIAENEREARLRDLFSYSPRITSASYANVEGKVIRAVYKGQVLPGMPVLGDDLNSKTYFTSPFEKQKVTFGLPIESRTANQKPLTLFGVPVLNNGKSLGVIIVTFDLNQQWDNLIKAKLNDNPRLRDTIRTYIFNNDNILLANSGFPAPANVQSFVKHDTVLKALADNANQPAQRLSNPDTDPATDVKGIVAILAVKPPIADISNLGLFVTVEEPEDVAFEAVNAARQTATTQTTLIWIATAIAAVVAFIIGIVAALAIVRPVRKLTSGARTIAAGDLDAQVTIRSQDEIGELAENFNLMAQKLKAANAVAETYLNPKAIEMVRRSYEEDDLRKLETNTEEKVMTLFFSDIVSFTTSTEKLGPAQSIARLNAYYEVVSSLLQNTGGKIDKYVADEIVAIFEDGSDHAYQAVKAALLTLEALEMWNRASGFEPVKIRIGINTGECIVANIGSAAARRFDRTVIGDAVNTTQRLMASAAHNSIVISEATCALLGNRVRVQLLEPLALKGKTEKVAAYQGIGLVEKGVAVG
jgi:class 3 adenylate cyclase